MLSIAQKCLPVIGRRLLVAGSYCNCKLIVPSSTCGTLIQNILPVSSNARFYSQRNKYPPISQTSPELLHYWHPTKNINITPDDVSIKSFDKVWWKCPKGVDHEWECSVRYALKSDMKTVNCPFCFNKRVSITNSLVTRYPEIAAQWHPTKNGSLLPSQVTYVSNTAVWWQCDRDPSHVWKREIRKRVHPLTASQGLCPYCSGTHPTVRTLDVAFPEIAKEWNYERNGELVPSDVSKSSSAVVWWKCSKGHEWRTSVNNRTSSHHSGCPICKGHEISLERSLAYQYPELAVQWHPTKNLPLLPSTVFPYSNRSVWWVCNLNRPSNDASEETVQFGNYAPSTNECVGCGQEWQESIKNRVSKYKGSHNLLCPSCSTKNRKQTASPHNSPKKPSESKKLKKIRIVGGNDNQDVIMVSASDYENLIALESYEPVEENVEKPVVMKEVYGKQKSPYRHVSTNRETHGPRRRVVLESDSKESQKESESSDHWEKENETSQAKIDESESEMRNETEGEIETEEDELLNSLNDLSDIDQYIPKEKHQVNEGEEEEQGWSI